MKIYVKLLEEGVDVWRPVDAEHLKEKLYRISPQKYDHQIELWQFEPGDIVVCDHVNTSDGLILAALRRAEIS